MKPRIADRTAGGDAALSETTSECEDISNFAEKIESEILNNIPGGRRILLKTIGDDSDQNMGSEIQIFLQDNGYDVVRIISKTMFPKPEKDIRIEIDEYSIQVIVSPSASCLVVNPSQ